MGLGHAVPCRAAGLVIEAPNLLVTPGSSGSFDVLVVNSNAAGAPSYGVSLDSLDLALSGPAGVTFTDVTINTIVPYIYTISATSLPGSNPLNFGITFPNTAFTVFDSDGGSPFFRTVDPGDRFGLANISYTVSPTFSGTDAITIASLNVGRRWRILTETRSHHGDERFDPMIPEPSTLIQATTAVLIGIGAVVRRLWREYRPR